MKKPPSESQPRFIQRIAPFTLRDGFSNTDESYKLNLAEVQRYRLHKLRKAVIKAVFDIQVPSKPGGKEGPEKAIDDALRAYIRALQDHDYMQSSLASRARDPFEFAGWRLDDRKLFESVIGELDGDVEKRKSDLAQDHERVPIGYGWETESDTIRLFSGLSSQSRSREESSAFIHRLVIAAFGAAFLIGPMWLMMLRTELWTKLISTTVFVAVFGLIMAYFVKEDNDVLSSTAAYAAVLVVFVGLSSES
ncbi:hypothetical protein QBC37DRAFT_296033 [Rhypophila decipiens]|uniref:DUF6594 domain-containing protein n=1 Tax=Rhypophila decipiens TaxID=261697 RepID=A0AAN7B5C7_9PEZI|nr:hypothetical protein QBC37DRAFT_296033 [Rhypophila decipiens]